MKNESFESIEKILEKIENAEAAPAPEKEHDQPSPDLTGLVFEYSAEGDAEDETSSDGEALTENAPEPSATEEAENDASADPADSADDGDGEADETEDASDVAEVDAPETVHEEPATRIWKTYVPRFTEASETYRLRGDARIRAQIREKVENGEEIPDASDADVDPTAEYDEDVSADIVHTPETNAEEDAAEVINIYKFNVEDDFLEELDGRTAEDEQKEIDELLDKAPVNAATAPATPPEETPDDDGSDEDEEGDGVEDEEESTPEIDALDMPDPDSDKFSVHDYHGAPDIKEDEPSGISEAIAQGDKKDNEFRNHSERDSFKDKFLDSLLSIRIRMVFALLFSAAMLIVELLSAFNVISYPVFEGSKVNSALAIFDLLLASCVLIFALPEIIRSMKHLFRKKPLAELYTLCAFIVLVGYTVAIALTNALEYPLFGLLFAMIALPVIGGALYRTKADFLAFKMVAQTEEKQILDKRNTRELPAQNVALDGIVDEYKSKIVRTFRTSFISDFFKNSTKVEKGDANFALIFFVTLGVSLIAGTVTYFLASSFVSAISVFTLVFLLSIPAFSPLSGKLTFFHSQKAAISEECAAIGEGALYNFASSDVVAFDDTEIFGPDDVNLVRFKLYSGREDMDRVMRQMCALFAVVGGPLDFIFANVIDNRLRHKTASDAIIEDDGLSGIVNGHRICAGTEEYMRRNGIAIPESNEQNMLGIETTKIMYGAEDGEINVKYYIRYSFSEEFTMILPYLKEEGVVPLVYTRDPNISNELLMALSTGSDCMRVMRLYTPAINNEKVYSRVSAEIVSYGDKINAINMILLAKRYKKFSEKIKFAELSASFVAIILAIALSFIGLRGATVIVAALWQIIWCVALRYLSDFIFLRDKRKRDKEDEQ